MGGEKRLRLGGRVRVKGGKDRSEDEREVLDEVKRRSLMERDPRRPRKRRMEQRAKEKFVRVRR